MVTDEQDIAQERYALDDGTKPGVRRGFRRRIRGLDGRRRLPRRPLPIEREPPDSALPALLPERFGGRSGKTDAYLDFVPTGRRERLGQGQIVPRPARALH